MSTIARRPSVVELSQRILDMAKTGVYRESVFEALKPVATKKQIREAIAHAKKFGLHSVASLRDEELGTYYEVDLVKLRSIEHTISTPVPSSQSTDLTKQTTDAIVTIRLMLTAAKGAAIALTIIGFAYLLTGKQQASFGLFSSAASAAGLWILQKAFAKKVDSQS
ncbi:hypothetical protein H6F88_09975 [Oculatella sp. FACHB-28]|uniref:hypothetical protein n=1 Tax=Oculatella sp. FACHB-28 TaxID=2692845 RepID=UPI001684A7A9|nr:hypothetical protein [Oculatella sp. FACHB-28]MBD2056343.1 hypothetical protein [Oculatella sp. FACHB-28]